MTDFPKIVSGAPLVGTDAGSLLRLLAADVEIAGAAATLRVLDDQTKLTFVAAAEQRAEQRLVIALTLPATAKPLR